MGWLFVPFSYFVVVGSSNAVNLTDGLDGLAILPTVMVATGLGVIAYLTGHIEFADYLNIAYLPGTASLLFSVAQSQALVLDSLVQYLSGDDFYGRRRCAGSWRSARRGSRDDTARNRFIHHGRDLRAGDGVRHHSGDVLQTHRQPRLSNGAHSPPF